ncbi:MAG: rod shape-determining protein RodA [Gemmatimonadetes bacterium]|nr:rod shape-determining protein RodA [Gemmatimonadota bacterium]
MAWYRRWARDPALVTLAFALSFFGIAMIFSAGVLNAPSPVTEDAWQRQFLWLILALAAFTVVTRVRSDWIEWLSVPAYLIAVVLLAATLAIGTGAGTAEGVGRWIQVGAFRFQPSEFAKVAAVLGLARLLSAREDSPRNLRDLLAPCALIAVPLALVVLQPDLGTALAFLGILFAALFWVGTPALFLFLLASPGLALILSFDVRVWSVYFVGLVGMVYALRYRLYLAESISVVFANLAAGTVALPLWNSLEQYQKNRLLVFLKPALDPRGAGWNLIQSKVAIGSGGLFGKGFTEGTQKRLDFLPEQHTDFIFGVVGEELGFVGVLAAIALFSVFLLRLVRLAERSPDPFAGLVLIGIFGTWLVHIFVNLGMTIGIVPITGIPLPFVSYGGTFLLTCWVMTGLSARLAGED